MKADLAANSRRTSRIAWGVLVLCLVFAALAWWSRTPSRLPVDAPVAVAGVSTTKVSHAPATAHVASAVPPLPGRTQAAAADEIEVCGLGRLKRSALMAESAFDSLFDKPMKGAVEDVLRNLDGATDERARAAALLVRERMSAYDAVQEWEARRTRGDLDCNGRVCPVPDLPQGKAAREALARVATATRDPVVYAMAFQACRTFEREPQGGSACGQLSAERWARIDPRNAVPWLYMADQARARRDEGTVAEAMYQVSQASISDPRFGRLPALVGPYLREDASAVAQIAASTMLFGIDAAMTLPNYQLVFHYCAKEQLNDANRRQTCGAIAELMVNRSTAMQEVGIGLGLARRLDWSAERLTAIEQRRDAYYAAAKLVSDMSPEILTCEGTRKFRQHLRNIGELGEIGAYQAVIARSGRSIADLAKEHRTNMQQQREQAAKEMAQEAASAASTASAPPR